MKVLKKQLFIVELENPSNQNVDEDTFWVTESGFAIYNDEMNLKNYFLRDGSNWIILVFGYCL